MRNAPRPLQQGTRRANGLYHFTHTRGHARIHTEYGSMTASGSNAGLVPDAWCASAAWMNAMNKGWPERGVDLNSGWYCTPMYHGCAFSPLRGNSMISHSDSVGVRAATTRPASSTRPR